MLEKQAEGKKENEEKLLKRLEKQEDLEKLRKKHEKTQNKQEKIKSQRGKISAEKVRERVKEEKEDKKALEKQIKKEKHKLKARQRKRIARERTEALRREILIEEARGRRSQRGFERRRNEIPDTASTASFLSDTTSGTGIKRRELRLR